MYEVIFNDRVWGKTTETFDDLDKALEYWEQFKDTATCESGVVMDCETGVAQFSESTGKGGICLFGGWATTVLTIPLLPFALVWRGLYEAHKWLKKIFNRSAS